MEGKGKGVEFLSCEYPYPSQMVPGVSGSRNIQPYSGCLERCAHSMFVDFEICGSHVDHMVLCACWWLGGLPIVGQCLFVC